MPKGTDPEKRSHVHADLAARSRARAGAVGESDELRDCEGRQDFGARFGEPARSGQRRNAERAARKRQVNERLASSLMEEKAQRESGGACRSALAQRQRLSEDWRKSTTMLSD